MNNRTKSYFTALFMVVLIFSGAKYIIHSTNKTKKVNLPVVVTKEQTQETIKKAEPVIKMNKPVIVQKGLKTGGNWSSR